MSTESIRPTGARTATVLERAIARAQEGAIDSKVVLWTLAASEIVFINQGQPQQDEFPSAPLTVKREGSLFMAVFTSRELAVGLLESHHVPVHTPALEVLRRIPADSGLVVNPGSRLGFELPSDGLRAFVLDVLETNVAV